MMWAKIEIVLIPFYYLQSFENTTKSIMKQIFFLFALSIAVFSCQNENSAEEQSVATIKGSILNSESEEFALYIDNEKIDIQLDADTFEYQLDLRYPKVVMFYGDDVRETVYVAPGHHVSFEVDASKEEDVISFTGQLAKENLFMRTVGEKELPPMKRLFSSDEETFVNFIDKYDGEVKEILVGAAGQGELPAEFLELMSFEHEYDVAGKLDMFENYHQYFSGNDSFQISEALQTRIDAIQLDNPDAIHASSYQDFVNSYVMGNAWEQIKDDEELRSADGALAHAALKVVDQNFKSPEARGQAFYAILENALYDGLQKEEQTAYDRFVAENTNPEQLEKINADLEKWKKLDPGQVAPAFVYDNISGEKVALADLKGKVVYIDVWATWCGPCLAEQPDLFALEEELHGNEDVAIIGVSIDDDAEAWKNMVEAKEMKGIQLIADNAWSSGIVKDYLISGIPRFIMIDPNGNIIRASAPRPSSGKVKDMIIEEIEKHKEGTILGD